MTRYYKVECPRCEGEGTIRYHLVFERPCALCRGKGLVTDYEQPVEMMPQPEAEIRMMRSKTTAELLADTIPLGKKTTTALLSPRRGVRHETTGELLGEDYAPVAGGRFEDDDEADTKRKYIEGAESERRDFSGRMRQR